jgi:hypothetical protein
MKEFTQADKIKRMPVGMFRELGLLQEVNRLFLHPRGLALEVVVDEDGERFGGIWDYREDPEGMAFAGDLLKGGHTRIRRQAVERMYQEHLEHRQALFGTEDGIQPLP